MTANRKINLFVNSYTCDNVARQKELDHCLKQNKANIYIDNIVLINGGRPTYNQFFALTHTFPNDINIIANSDIYFNQTLGVLKKMSFKDKCFALSRWDVIHAPSNEKCYDAYNNIKHYDSRDSQDVWIFDGTVLHIAHADFTLGRAGSDNKIAYLLEQNGYNVTNPSKTIQAIHLHLSNYRTYLAQDRLQPPYKLIESSYL